MTTLAQSTTFDLPRLSQRRIQNDRTGVARPGTAFSFVLMGLGALLIATVLYTAGVAFMAPGYTVVAETLIEQNGALLTVIDGRY